VDYRTTLLARAREKWGLCSRDGRCLTPRQFRKRLAWCHADFGAHHLCADSVDIGCRALARAWRTDPVNLKYLAKLIAARLGWRPSRD
jgi:hypothetical protein